MPEDRSMWTPIESALAPFKELARINRHAVRDADGRDRQLILQADACRVTPGPAGTSTDSATIQLGFTLGPNSYAVHFVGASYRRGGGWEYSRITRDISAGLQSGACQPGTSFLLGRNAKPAETPQSRPSQD